MLRQSLRSDRRSHSSVKAALAVVVFMLALFRAHAEVSTPDTPAGHTLQAFLDAFDGGDHEKIAA
jgi:hypothetical protein